MNNDAISVARPCNAVDIVIEPGDLTRYHFIVGTSDKPGWYWIASLDSVKFRGYEYNLESVKKLLEEVEMLDARLTPGEVLSSYLGYICSLGHSDCDRWTALAACDAIVLADRILANRR